MNTIASSFGCLSTIVSQLHRYTTSRAGGVSVVSSPSPSPRCEAFTPALLDRTLSLL